MHKNKNEFSLYLEELKMRNEFDTYIETIVHFYENETDQEMENITKMLNRKILERLQIEARDRNMIKEVSKIASML